VYNSDDEADRQIVQGGSDAHGDSDEDGNGGENEKEVRGGRQKRSKPAEPQGMFYFMELIGFV
jgi:hypothetical protein